MAVQTQFDVTTQPLERPGEFSPPPHRVRSSAVNYPGFPSPVTATHTVKRLVRMGEVARLQVKAGDVVAIVNVDGGAEIGLVCFDTQDQSAAGILEATETPALRAAQFEPVLFGMADKAASLKGLRFGDISSPSGETLRLRVRADGELAAVMLPALNGMQAGCGGTAEIVCVRAKSATNALPPHLGRVREDIHIPASSAKAYRVKKGEYIQIIDVEGQQCTDFMALRDDALARGIERSIDATVTRTIVGAAFPNPGLADKYFDQDMRPLLAVVQDTVGRHDTFALACTGRGYEERGFPGHINCSDNISDALAPFGVTRRAAWPAINLFFNSWILPSDNRLRSDEAWSRAGDYVVFKALEDLLCVSTACPDDIDPINGWNPTDIYVRIYHSDAVIPTSVAYRAQTQIEPTLTQHSAFHPRTSALTRNFAVARDVWLPVNFESTRANEEAATCRSHATVQDLSSLLKFDVIGPDAERLLDLALTRDIKKLSVHRGVYALVCDPSGVVIDDGTLFRLAPDLFRWCCGSEHSALQLKALAAEHQMTVWIRAQHQSMPNLALQGPLSRDILRKIVFTQPTQPSIDNLKWFGFTQARLHDRDGAPFMLTRTGYTGELGYEIFCHAPDAVKVWDAVMEAGAPMGLLPMGGEALAMIRVEAGMAAYGAEFGRDIDAFEAGLGFAVDLAKSTFIGQEALQRIAAAPRRVMIGLKFGGNDAPAHGDQVFDGRNCIGTVTSATRSQTLGCAIAMARVAVEYKSEGRALEVGRLDGFMKRLPCTTHAIPFVDPQRSRARA